MQKPNGAHTVVRPLVLVYHKVSPFDDAGVSSISPQALREQVSYLASIGYRGVTISDLLDSKDELNCSIFFDDAYENVIDHAVPVLSDAGFTATIAVVTDYVGKENTWDVRFGPRFRHMTWSQIGALNQIGWEVASHTCSHRSLSVLPPRQLVSELEASKNAIEDRIGEQVRHLVYPFGQYRLRLESAIRDAGYLSASGLTFRLVDGPYAIRRIPIYSFDDTLSFKRKINNDLVERSIAGFVSWWVRGTILLQYVNKGGPHAGWD
jgi:peptidoglycan/xylan/chitin deacetylase (PgdA/CDA1 family)